MHRNLLLCALGLSMAYPAIAQIKPLPRDPLVKTPTVQQPTQPKQPAKPGTPIATPTPAPASGSTLRAPRTQTPQLVARFSPPVLELQSASTERTPGQLSGFTVKVSNVGTARFVHLYSLDMGCKVDIQPGISGLGIFRTGFSREVSLTSDQGSASRFSGTSSVVSVIFNIRDQAGTRVDASGTATFPLTGVTGVDAIFSGDMISSPDHAAIQSRGSTGAPGSGYLPFLRRIAPIDANNSTCIPSAFVALRDATGGWYVHDERGNRLPLPASYDRTTLDTLMPIRVIGKPWFIKAHRRVTVEDTGRLSTLLKRTVKAQGAGSKCSGISSTPHGNFPVGNLSRGGDMAMVIRSGPLGTKCAFTIEAGLLPPGVLLENATFSVSRVGSKCTMDGRSPAIVFPGGFALDRVTQQIQPATKVTGSGRFGGTMHGWLNPFVFPDPGLRYNFQGYTTPLVATLDCEATLLNDHEITLVMERATFHVPIGTSFP